MHGTTAEPVTSSGKLCAECAAPFAEDDDRRYSRCAVCRGGGTGGDDVPVDYPDEPMTVETAPSDLPAGVRPFTLDHSIGRVPPAPATRFYWCGLIPKAPRQAIALGGVEIVKDEGRLVDRGNGKREMQDHSTGPGKILSLTDAQIALVLEHAACKVVRNYREDVRTLVDGTELINYTGDIFSTRGSGARATDDGIPQLLRKLDALTGDDDATIKMRNELAKEIGERKKNLPPKYPYRPHPNDKPLGQFVFIMEVRHKSDRPVEIPPTLIPWEG